MTRQTFAIYRDRNHPRELLAIEYKAVVDTLEIVRIDNAAPFGNRVTRRKVTFDELRALLFPPHMHARRIPSPENP